MDVVRNPRWPLKALAAVLLLPRSRESQQQGDVTFRWVGVLFWHAYRVI